VRATIADTMRGTLTSPSTICETPPSASISRFVSSAHRATLSTSVTPRRRAAPELSRWRGLADTSTRTRAGDDGDLALERSSLRIAVMASPDLLFLMLNDNGDGIGAPAGKPGTKMPARVGAAGISPKKFRRLD